MKNDKLKLNWIQVCSSSSVDRDSNSFSLFNVIEEITVNINRKRSGDFPSKDGVLVPFPFEIVALLSKTADEQGKELSFSAKISINDPRGRIVNEFPIEAVVGKDKKRIRLNIKASGLKVTCDGEYLFRLEIKSKSAKSYDFMGEVPIEVSIK